MARDAFTHVTTWVFDLDNTLYPPTAALLEDVAPRMTTWIMQALSLSRPEADHLRLDYWTRYGTTLAGLMAEHGVDPHDFLHVAHDVPLDGLVPCPDLRAAIAALPGRRVVFTNSSADWARRVVAARGLDGLFDGLYGVEDAGFQPKPMRAAFEAVFEAAAVTPSTAAMFEDDPRNLAVPHAMGMRTVHVAPTPDPAPHIHHHADDLAGFLHRLA
jgi:putative hydrolase of the HAD superfamily